MTAWGQNDSTGALSGHHGLPIDELVAQQFVAFEVGERAAQVAIAVFAAGADAGGAANLVDGARFVDMAVQRNEGLVAFDGGAHRLAAYRPHGRSSLAFHSKLYRGGDGAGGGYFARYCTLAG